MEPVVLPAVRPDGLELASGWLFGRADGRPRPAVTTVPRAALESVILGHFAHDRPMYVAFSGGRDSSAILAVAVHVARREGFPDPIPVTTRYPGLPETVETDWQTMILRYLGVKEHVVIRVAGEESVLGEPARASLLRRGLLWPAAAQLQDHLLDTVKGGVLLTGEGGDEILGRRRITPLTLLIRLRRRPSRALVRESTDAVLPRALWRQMEARRMSGDEFSPWLTRNARSRVVDRLVHDRQEPLRWERALWRYSDLRAACAVVANFAVVGADHDVRVGHPLMSSAFLAALSASGGVWGYAGRTDMMRRLFGDLLPEELIARRSKASFSSARFGNSEREFARSWNGSGVDTELVHAEALRAHWLSDAPSGSSGLLMQAAWLHGQGRALDAEAGR